MKSNILKLHFDILFKVDLSVMLLEMKISNCS